MTKPDIAKSPEYRQMQERMVVDMDRFDAWLGTQGMAWQPLSRGEYGVSLEEAQLYYICTDPVLWCKAFMTEPDTGEPYKFWDYQEVSARSWNQDVVHQDGAEVGKTREITALLLWGMCTGFGYTIKNPSVLVGAPQQTHLDEIIMGIEAHVGESEGADGQKPIINQFWRKPKKHPHYMMRFKGPTCSNNQLGLIYFRPAGHDGEAFRGVHVNAGGFFDEAAKIKNPVCWSEFWRSLKPNCFKRVYSVPDGDNTTEFYKYTQQAIENLPNTSPGWRKFHWPKTIMPHPFWSEARDDEFKLLFGGKDSPGYQRNVMGLHGQQENPVWPWNLLERNIHHVPEYRVIRLRADADRDELNIECRSIELIITESNDKPQKTHESKCLEDRTDALSDYKTKDSTQRRNNVRQMLRELLEPVTHAVLWGGADLGFSNDPTEIRLFQEVGTEWRDLVRIHAKGLEYDLQCEVIYCLDELFGFQANWGVDFGNAGTAVVQDLTNLEIFDDGNYEERLTGFQFASSVECIDEKGNILEEDGKPVTMPAKAWATELITKRMQRGGRAMPYDNEVIGHYQNHTAKEGAKHRIFSKKDDHTIDAERVAMLRKVFNEEVGSLDAFSSSARERVA